MAYSLEFRNYVLRYKERNALTFEQTSQHFNIGARTLFRWSKQKSNQGITSNRRSS
ncbi:hypothetical protein QRL16_001929 [Vibrio parahaemolyticus]|uniref:IS630 transposase-related protein n=1 Tax=Vibrio parahaemolyticus TaxID=670 RepID=UPI00280FB7ED|nr:hypothetical protein [Vibrio parahaemolyticus]